MIYSKATLIDALEFKKCLTWYNHYCMSGGQINVFLKQNKTFFVNPTIFPILEKITVLKFNYCAVKSCMRSKRNNLIYAFFINIEQAKSELLK